MVALDSVFQFFSLDMSSGKICSRFLKMQYKGGHYFASFLAKKNHFESGGIPTWYQRAFHAQRGYFQVWTEA